MRFRDCITSAMTDGHISREAGDEYIARYDEFVEDGIGRSPFHESQARAAQRLQGEIERKIQRTKRVKVKQALAIDRIKQRLTPGQVEKAAVAGLDFDPKLEHVGDNITIRHESTRGMAFALMSDFRFRSKHGGLTRETAGMDDVVAGFFGESLHRAWHTPSLVRHVFKVADGKMTTKQAAALAARKATDLFTATAWRIKEKLRGYATQTASAPPAGASSASSVMRGSVSPTKPSWSRSGRHSKPSKGISSASFSAGCQPTATLEWRAAM